MKLQSSQRSYFTTEKAAKACCALTLVVGLSVSSASAQTYSGFAALDQGLPSFRALGVDVADFDHDGDLDVVMTSNLGELRLLRNNGTGILVPWHTVTMPGFLERPVVGDLNNDGNMDIVCPNQTTGVIQVIKTNFDGSLQPPQALAFGVSPRSVALADFDSNGFLDIVAVSQSIDTAKVYLGNGTSFPTVRTFATNLGETLGKGPHSVAAGDLNNDGKPDIVTANTTSHDMGVYYASGNGFFFTGEFAYYVAQPSKPYEVELVDMDNDGDKDIVLSRGIEDAQITWMRNRYDGGTEIFPNFDDGAWSTFVGGRVVDLAVGVFTCNSSLPDIAGANEQGTDLINVLTNPGIGALTARPSLPSPGGSPEGVATGDFDNDGDMDIIACAFFGGYRVYLNQCLGTNCPVDFNGDGILNFFDVSFFISAYAANNPIADLAAPAGVFNFFDVSAFLNAFSAGCP